MNIHRIFTRRARQVMAAVGLCALATIGAAAAAPAASAAATYYPLISNLNWLNVGVRDGSTGNGTDIIQWTADGAADQQWDDIWYSNTEDRSVHRFKNQGSGKCLTTDGVPGDVVYQQDCSPTNRYQAWQASYIWWAAGYQLYNTATGLVLDVQGASYDRGAEIDVWYPNGGLNQVFSMPGDLI